MGRRTKLTPELQEKIVQIIRSGNYRSVAAEAVGIHPDTFSDWMTKKRQPYLRFHRAVLRAEADAQRMMVNSIVKAGAQGDWRAALEFLARKFPKEWAKKDFQGVLGADGKPTDMPTGVLVVPGPLDESGWLEAAARYKTIQPRAEEPNELTTSLMDFDDEDEPEQEPEPRRTDSGLVIDEKTQTGD